MSNKKKFLILGFSLLVLVGCTNVRDVDGSILKTYIISWGDSFPLNNSDYGLFDKFIVWPLAQLFNFLSQYVGAFWSLILGTIIVNLTKLRSSIKSSVQQEKISLIQPEIDKLNKMYEGKDDQDSKMELAQRTQQLYKDHDINLFGSLGGMLLQLPIIFAMFQAVQRAESIINGSVLGHSFNGTPKEGFLIGNKVYIIVFIAMAILQALSMFAPSYLQKKKSKTEGPNTNSMTMVSLAMIIFLGFTWNIGMSVYWGISALTQLLQTLFIHYRYKNA